MSTVNTMSRTVFGHVHTSTDRLLVLRDLARLQLGIPASKTTENTGTPQP